MRDRCGTCRYFCGVRKHPTYQEILTHICTYFLLTEQSDYILETTENDVCECWKQRDIQTKDTFDEE